MSTENKPLEKEEIVNGDENVSNVQPEQETESESIDKETNTENETFDPAGDDDTGGSSPSNKPRG